MQDKNYPNVKKILLALAEHLNVKGIRGLARALGEEESRLYAWIRNKNIVDTGVILSKCPNIRIEWLKTGEGEMLQNKFQQFSTKRLEEMAVNEVVSDAQSRYASGTIKLSFFDEALFYMMQDLPDEARRRVHKDIIMEWTSARRKKPTE